MIIVRNKLLQLGLLLLTAVLGLTACGVASQVVNHEANDQRLLKPGALDLPINQTYRSYKYVFLDKYKVTHDWVFVGSCSYGSVEDVSGKTVYTGNIFEKDERTYVDRESSAYPKDSRYKYGIKNLNITKYTRPEWQNGTYSNGNPRIAKGFQPMCNQAWQISQHVIEIELRKQNINELMAAAKKYDPKLVFETRQVNNNKWQVRYSELGPAPLNGAGGPFQTWLLPIGDTGYTFIFGLGANQDSLQHPQAHAQMQAIFKHLIESVKIEPIKP